MESLVLLWVKEVECGIGFVAMIFGGFFLGIELQVLGIQVLLYWSGE